MKTTGWAKTFSVLALTVLAISGLASPAQAAPSAIEGTDPAAIMFDPTRVDSISLQMTWSDYESLRYPKVSWNNEGDWRETRMTATIAGKRYGPLKVGVHLKGAWGSWRDVGAKAAFKIKLDAFVKDQTLLGVKKLTLNNMVQDGSYIHEVMTYKVMRAMGVPAPRTGYTSVTLNGVDYGLHLNVETVDDQMLKRWGVTSKHLYKGGLPYLPDFNLGADWQYVVETGDEVDTSDLTDFIALNQLRGDQWWNAIKLAADMDQITKSWAVELFTGHWDGYVVNKNNYYVNFDDEGKVSLIPWGTDQTWGGNYDYFNFNALLPNKCKGSTECTDLYLQNLAKLARVVNGLNLYEYGNRVKIAIAKAIQNDRFSSGLAAAENAQQAALSRFAEEAAILNSMVTPWDTTVNSVKVGDSVYQPEQIIYLQPAQVNQTVLLTPSRIGAIPSEIYGPYANGLNKMSYTVISADGIHSSQGTLNLYLLTQRSSLLTLRFDAGSTTLGKTSLSQIKALGSKLKGSRNIELTFGIPSKSNKSTAEAKVRKIVAAIRSTGGNPTKITRVYIPGTSQSIKLSTSYQN